MNELNINEDNIIHGYKGFDPGLICRDKHYKENTVFEEPDIIMNICHSGMHFCKHPLNVLNYYPPCTKYGISEYAKVDALGNIIENNDKCCTDILKIGEKMDLLQFVTESLDDLMDNASFTNTGDTIQPVVFDDQSNKKVFNSYTIGAISIGNNSISTTTKANTVAMSSGNGSAAVSSGFSSATITTGSDSTSVNCGYSSISAAMNNSSIAVNQGANSIAINMGRGGVAIDDGQEGAAVSISPFSAAINKGNFGTCVHSGIGGFAISEGKYNIALNRGDGGKACANGEGNIAIETGHGGFASGALGSWIVLTEWDKDLKTIINIKSHKVDGKEIESNTLYTLKNGEFIKCQSIKGSNFNITGGVNI